jgi:hypothetical protein
MNREHLIRRYEHNYFRDWVVSTKRQGKRLRGTFQDYVLHSMRLTAQNQPNAETPRGLARSPSSS